MWAAWWGGSAPANQTVSNVITTQRDMYAWRHDWQTHAWPLWLVTVYWCASPLNAVHILNVNHHSDSHHSLKPSDKNLTHEVQFFVSFIVPALYMSTGPSTPIHRYLMAHVQQTSNCCCCSHCRQGPFFPFSWINALVDVVERLGRKIIISSVSRSASHRVGASSVDLPSYFVPEWLFAFFLLDVPNEQHITCPEASLTSFGMLLLLFLSFVQLWYLVHVLTSRDLDARNSIIRGCSFPWGCE